MLLLCSPLSFDMYVERGIMYYVERSVEDGSSLLFPFGAKVLEEERKAKKMT